MWRGVVEVAGGDEARWMRNIGQQEGAYFVGHGTQGCVIPVATVSRGSTNDELGLHFAGFVGHLRKIDEACFFFYPIKMRLVQFAAEVYG